MVLSMGCQVLLWATPLESGEESAQRGGVGPHYVGEDRASWGLAYDEVLQLDLEGL